EHAIAAGQCGLGRVVAEATPQQVGKVQTQAPADRIEVEQTEYPQGRGRPLNLIELPLAQTGIEPAGQTLEAEPGRRTRPAGIGVQAETLTTDTRRIIPGTEHRGQVLALQTPLVPAAGTARRAFPAGSPP